MILFSEGIWGLAVSPCCATLPATSLYAQCTGILRYLVGHEHGATPGRGILLTLEVLAPCFWGVSILRQQEVYFCSSSGVITQFQTVLDCLHVNGIFFPCICCYCISINWGFFKFPSLYSFYNNQISHWILNSILNVRQVSCEGRPPIWCKSC